MADMMSLVSAVNSRKFQSRLHVLLAGRQQNPMQLGQLCPSTSFTVTVNKEFSLETSLSRKWHIFLPVCKLPVHQFNLTNKSNKRNVLSTWGFCFAY